MMLGINKLISLVSKTKKGFGYGSIQIFCIHIIFYRHTQNLQNFQEVPFNITMQSSSAGWIYFHAIEEVPPLEEDEPDPEP